jgi:hypothetical protein
MSDRDVNATPPSLMAEALGRLTQACTRRPWTTLLVVGLLTTACVVYTTRALEFKTDRADLIDPSAPFHQRWLHYTESFGESSDIVVAVESNEPETIKQAIDRLGERLREHPELFQNVLYKLEPGALRQKGLQYLSPEQLAVGLKRLEEYRPILNGRWDLVRLENLVPLLRLQWEDQRSHSPTEAQSLLEHADRLTESLARFVADRNDFINPWPEILPVSAEMRDQAKQTVYLLNEAGTMGFLMATPAKGRDNFQGATTAIDRIRRIIAQTRSEFPGTNILLTGIPVLENDEMRRSQQDSSLAGIVSFLGVGLLLFIGLRGVTHPVLGLLTLAIGMAWSFGFATLVVGHLNILTVSFASIVIGLGNDFAIHLLSRYLDLRHHGLDLRHALVESSGSIGPGIVTGAITTALAFFCASFTPFLGVAELGVIAGGGIVLCTLATFTALPAMVALTDRRTEEKALPVPFQGKWLRRATTRYPGMVLALSLAAFAWVGWRACDWSQGWPRPRTAYDHNLLHLQAEGLESVEAQKRIFDSSQNSLLYAISLANSAEEARQLKERFLALPTVRHVEELASRLPAHPPSETRLYVMGFHAQLANLPQQPPAFTPSVPAQVGRLLEEFLNALQRESTPLARRIGQRLDQFLDILAALDTRDQVQLLTEFQYRLAYSLLAQFQALSAASDPDPVTADDLPAELRARYVSPTGQWLLQVFPKDQIWDMAPLEAFVRDVRTVDAEVTGTPLQNYEAALQLKHSYEMCSVYALTIILLILLVDFIDKDVLWPTLIWPGMAAFAVVAFCLARQQPLPVMPLLLSYTAAAFLLAAIWDRQSVWDALLAIVPPLLGLLLTFGLLAIIDLPLNPANLIILPLIIGIGVDNGVHVLHDYHAQPHQVYSPSPSLVNAITMTSSTSIVGFGSMMMAAHRGLYSLGAVLSLGVASCAVMALVTLPAYLAWISRHRPPPAAQAAPSEQSGELPAEDAAQILPLRSRSRVA